MASLWSPSYFSPCFHTMKKKEMSVKAQFSVFCFPAVLVLGCLFPQAAPGGQSCTKPTGRIRRQPEHVTFISWLLTKTSKRHFDYYLTFCTTLRPTPAFTGAFRFLHCWKVHTEHLLLVLILYQLLILCQLYNGSLTHLFTVDFVVATQIAGGGSADLSSSIWKQPTKTAVWNADSSELPAPALHYVTPPFNTVCWLYHGTC